MLPDRAVESPFSDFLKRCIETVTRSADRSGCMSYIAVRRTVFSHPGHRALKRVSVSLTLMWGLNDPVERVCACVLGLPVVI